ncbi:MAG: Rid family hydrolase [Nitrospirota bacterium]
MADRKPSIPGNTLKLHAKKTGSGELLITAAALGRTGSPAAAGESYRQISGILANSGMRVVHERILGSLAARNGIMHARSAELSAGGINPAGAVTYVEGNPPWGEGYAGTIIQAVPAGTEVRELKDGGLPCGRCWNAGDMRFIVVQGLQRPDCACGPGMDAPGDAEGIIRRARRILEENGASFRDVARTWFYLSDILSWYDGFNSARNRLYRDFGIMPGSGEEIMLPASTGVGGANPSGSACSLDLLAVIPSGVSGGAVRQIRNPRQMDAFLYNSAFSRGAVIPGPGGARTIYVSGTAAIDEKGASLYIGNAKCQIECTFEKVGALLKQEDAALEDIISATVFIKKPEYAELFYDIADSLGLSDFPAVLIVSDICRPELLFEFDAVAVTPPQFPF